jgi:hypothetical protein
MVKLLFVYSHPEPKYWKDGLYMALKELEKVFDITYQNLDFGKDVKKGFDFTLGWGGFGSPVDQYIHSCGGKKGLCIGGNTTGAWTDKYDVLFYETDWVRKYLKLDELNVPLVKAFGINSDLFKPPVKKVPIVWNYLGVGALASWKRWERFTNKIGKRLVIGDFQKNNVSESLDIVIHLMLGNVMVSNQVLPEDLPFYYHRAKTVYLPANIYGGSERCVLEARNAGCKVEIEADNDKLKELLTCKIPTYKDYAKALKQGLH